MTFSWTFEIQLNSSGVGYISPPRTLYVAHFFNSKHEHEHLPFLPALVGLSCDSPPGGRHSQCINYSTAALYINYCTMHEIHNIEVIIMHLDVI